MVDRDSIYARPRSDLCKLEIPLTGRQINLNEKPLLSSLKDCSTQRKHCHRWKHCTDSLFHSRKWSTGTLWLGWGQVVYCYWTLLETLFIGIRAVLFGSCILLAMPLLWLSWQNCVIYGLIAVTEDWSLKIYIASCSRTKKETSFCGYLHLLSKYLKNIYINLSQISCKKMCVTRLVCHCVLLELFSVFFFYFL